MLLILTQPGLDSFSTQPPPSVHFILQLTTQALQFPIQQNTQTLQGTTVAALLDENDKDPLQSPL